MSFIILDLYAIITICNYRRKAGKSIRHCGLLLTVPDTNVLRFLGNGGQNIRNMKSQRFGGKLIFVSEI